MTSSNNYQEMNDTEEYITVDTDYATCINDRTVILKRLLKLFTQCEDSWLESCTITQLSTSSFHIKWYYDNLTADITADTLKCSTDNEGVIRWLHTCQKIMLQLLPAELTSY